MENQELIKTPAGIGDNKLTPDELKFLISVVSETTVKVSQAQAAVSLFNKLARLIDQT